MRRLLLLFMLCACDTGSRSVPQDLTGDGECVPMPAECTAPTMCKVSTAPDGTRVCGGTHCCQSFCELNGCGRCCASPVFISPAAAAGSPSAAAP